MVLKERSRDDVLSSLTLQIYVKKGKNNGQKKVYH